MITASIKGKMNKTKTIEVILLLLICFLAIYLQTHSLLKSLAHDDIWSIEVMRSRPIDIIRMDAVPLDENPLYYMMMHFWINIFEVSELSLRLFSVLFGLFSIPMIYLIGKRFFNSRVGLMSAFLLSISIYLIENSQLIRSYTLFLFLSLLSIYFFGRYIKEHKTKGLILFSIVSVLNLYTHFFASFLLNIQILFFLMFARTKKKKFLLSILAILLLALPIILRMPSAFVFNQPSGGPNPCHILAFFNTIHYNMIHTSLIILLLSLFIIGLKMSYRSHKKITILAAMTFFIPLITAVLISCLNLFKPKHYIFILPFFIVMISNALFKFRKYWRMIILGLIILLSIFAIIDYYKRPYSPDWKSASDYISKNLREGDLVAASFYAYRPVDHYLSNQPILIKDYNTPEFGNISKNYKRAWIVYHDESYVCEDAKTQNIISILGYLDNNHRKIDQKIFPVRSTLHDIPATSIMVDLYEIK